MSTKYKFIHFVESEIEMLKQHLPHKSYECRNNNSKDTLGYLIYYKAWKQYIFSQSKQGCMFNSSCLLDIVDFLNQLNE